MSSTSTGPSSARGRRRRFRPAITVRVVLHGSLSRRGQRIGVGPPSRGRGVPFAVQKIVSRAAMRVDVQASMRILDANDSSRVDGAQMVTRPDTRRATHSRLPSCSHVYQKIQRDTPRRTCRTARRGTKRRGQGTVQRFDSRHVARLSTGPTSQVSRSASPVYEIMDRTVGLI